MAVADLVSSSGLLVLLMAAIVVQGLAANIMNVYTAGLSLVNTVPRLGRLVATIAVAVIAVMLSGFPDLIEEAQRWITHLGNFGAPLTGVVLADYLVVKRQHLDVDALFDPRGRYRYLNGVNVAAVFAVAVGFGLYFAVPDAWLKVVVGVAAGAVFYLGIVAIHAPSRRFEATTDSRRAT